MRADDKAIALYREAIRRAPGDAAGHYKLGLALARRQRHPEAVAALDEAIRLAPQRAEHHAHLAWELCQLGQFEAGAAAARRAPTPDPALVLGH